MNFSISNSKVYLAMLVLVCSTLLLVLVFSSEWLLRHRVEPAEHFNKHLQLLNHSTMRNVIVGDSRAARGFNHADFVNLAWPGDHLARTTQKLQWYMQRNRLDRVILAVDVLVFAAYRHQVFTQSQAEYPLKMPVWRISHPYYRQNLRQYWQRWLSGRGFTNQYQWHNNGWQSQVADWSAVPARDRQTRAAARAAQHQLLDDFANHPFADLLVQMLDTLNAQGAQVCLVSLPVSAEYVSAMQQQPNYAAIKAWINALAQAKKVPYHDFSTLFVNNADHFMDFDHLNVRGANAFTTHAVNACYTIN